MLNKINKFIIIILQSYFQKYITNEKILGKLVRE